MWDIDGVKLRVDQARVKKWVVLAGHLGSPGMSSPCQEKWVVLVQDSWQSEITPTISQNLTSLCENLKLSLFFLRARSPSLGFPNFLTND